MLFFPSYFSSEKITEDSTLCNVAVYPITVFVHSQYRTKLRTTLLPSPFSRSHSVLSARLTAMSDLTAWTEELEVLASIEDGVDVCALELRRRLVALSDTPYSTATLIMRPSKGNAMCGACVWFVM